MAEHKRKTHNSEHKDESSATATATKRSLFDWLTGRTTKSRQAEAERKSGIAVKKRPEGSAPFTDEELMRGYRGT